MAKMSHYEQMANKKLRENLYFYLQALQNVRGFELYIPNIKPLLSSFKGVEVDDKHIPSKATLDEMDLKYLDDLSILEVIEICLRKTLYIYSNSNTELVDSKIDSFLNTLLVKFLSRDAFYQDNYLDIAQRLSMQLGLD